MTVLDAYALIQTDAPQTRKLPSGKRAHGRSILRLWLRGSSPADRAVVLAKLGEPAKSLIEAELASGRLS